MTRITIGFATLLGTIGAAAGVLIPMIGELADATAPLGVSPQVWVTLGAALAGVVVIGRMAQAVAGTMHPPAPGPDELTDTDPLEATDVPAEAIPAG